MVVVCVGFVGAVAVVVADVDVVLVSSRWFVLVETTVTTVAAEPSVWVGDAGARCSCA